MTDDDGGGGRYAERPYLLIAMAALAFLGCVSLVAGTFIAQAYVPDHDWIADTISDLGAGQNEIIMDVALYGFAAGILATALAASHAHLGGAGWSVGVVSLAILSALVVIIAARNEYGDGDNEGVVVHRYVVMALGAMFVVVAATMWAGLGKDSTTARWLLIGLGGTWAVAAPVFFFLPTDIDGLYERVLGLIACGIVCVLAWRFYLRGRRAA